MELFTKDSQKFEEFFQELEAMRGRLASLAPEGDRKELERLAMNSESNIKYLETVIDDIETGRAKLEEHELIEEE